MKTTHTEFDAIIIGSGISGLMTALTLSEKKKILLLTKKKLVESATKLAQGGMAAVNEKTGDLFKEHEEDTMIAGAHHNKKATVKEVIISAPEIIRLLESYGMEFEEELTLEGGHSRNRIHHTKDTTGKTIEDALVRAIKKQKNISIVENALAIDLIMAGVSCHGCWYMQNDTIKTAYAKDIVLATGGAGQAYLHTTNPLVSTGDGIAMAHRIGAKIQDMEFIQFHPTALLDSSNPHFLLSESLRGEGAILRNSKKVQFMKNYDDRGELAPRDKVSQAIFQEQKNGKVYLDIRHKKAKWIHERFPTIYGAIHKKLKKDLAQDLIPVTPAAHYICGGVSVNSYGETTIPHLYAVGETAYTGLHGANRLASNSLLEAAVYGQKVGRTILKKQVLKEKEKLGSKEKTTHPVYTIAHQTFRLANMRKKIKEIMWNFVGIYRTKNGLDKAIFELERIQSILPPRHLINKDLIETRNLLEVGLLITQAAKARKKSLGCHWIEEKK